MSESVEKTVWQITFEKLQSNGIDVYPPALKKGECTEEYAVLKADGSSQIGTLSSESRYYTVMLYVPKNEYSRLEVFKKIVKEIFSKELSPMLMPTGQESPDFYDDTVKAHMVSITYRNSVRNSQL